MLGKKIGHNCSISAVSYQMVSTLVTSNLRHVALIGCYKYSDGPSCMRKSVIMMQAVDVRFMGKGIDKQKEKDKEKAA